MLTRGQIKRYLLPDLNVAGLRRWIVYQPLAVIMAILLLPSLSWMESGGAGARAFPGERTGRLHLDHEQHHSKLLRQ